MSALWFSSISEWAQIRPPEYAGTTSIVNQTGRAGDTSGCMSISSIGNFSTISLPTPAAVCFTGWANFYNGSNATALANVIMAWCTGTGTGRTIQCCLTLNTSGFYELRRTSATGTLLGTSSGHTPVTAFGVGTPWYDLNARCVLGASSNGEFELRLAGVPILTLTGITNSGSTASVDSISWAGNTGGNSGNTQNNVYWDDVVVYDAVDATATQGRANNDWPGDLRVARLLPTSDGDTTQWTPSTGTAHWSLLDEVPPNTTDYVSSATDGQQDLVNIADLSGTVSGVIGVRTGLYAAKTDAGAAGLKTLIKENSVLTVGSSQAVGGTGTFAGYFSSFRWVRPSDSAVWANADVNAMQIGVEADL